MDSYMSMQWAWEAYCRKHGLTMGGGEGRLTLYPPVEPWFRKAWEENERKKALQELEGTLSDAEELKPPAPAPQQAQSVMTDADILKRLVDTGFIAPNLLKDKTIYAKTRAVKVPALFGEVLKLTSNNEARAARIMRNNMSGIEAALNTHLSRLHNKP